MAFLNEKISDQDRSKYGLDEVDKKFVVGGTKSRYWTIDRDKDMYLRQVAIGREEICYQQTWTFYWHGELLVIYLDLIDAKGSRGGPGWAHWKIRDMKLPDSLQSQRDEIIADLKMALTAYKDAGYFSVKTTYSVTLDI